MKVSIITAVLNGKDTIENAIRSILSQKYKDIEHIIIDGGSTDGTLEIIGRYEHSTAKILSEPDKGIYDALNKGISLSIGEIIGVLHADDLYAHDEVLKTVVDVFKNQNVDSCYGDLQYVHKDDTNKVIRHWKSSEYCHGKFKSGWMPPHPTFF